MKWTKEFVEILQETFGAMDFGTLQPFSHLEFEPLIADEAIEKIQVLITEAKKQNIKPKDLAKKWPTVCSLRVGLFFTILNMKCIKTPKQTREKIAQFFYEMIQARAVEDTFGATSNIIQTKEEIKQKIKDLKPQKATPQDAKELGKLYNALYNYCAGVYLDFYIDYSAENEGPYDVSSIYGKNHILIIKKFIDMKLPIWKTKKPYNTVEIYTVYKDVKYSCDLISIHSMYGGDVINNLIDFAIIVDGKKMTDKEEIKALRKEMSQLSVEQYSELKSLPKEEQKQKAAFIKFFGMHKLFESVGIEWRPDAALLSKVKKEELKDNTFWKQPEKEKQQKEFWKKIYNPSTDFYAGDQ